MVSCSSIFSSTSWISEIFGAFSLVDRVAAAALWSSFFLFCFPLLLVAASGRSERSFFLLPPCSLFHWWRSCRGRGGWLTANVSPWFWVADRCFSWRYGNTVPCALCFVLEGYFHWGTVAVVAVTI